MKAVTTYGQKTICNFLEELAREVPTLPAGGSTLALAGALATALERFVARLKLIHKTDQKVRENYETLISRLEILQAKCIEMMDRDAKEYEKIIKAMKMSKLTQQDRARRKTALQEAKIAALNPPMMLIDYGLEMLQNAITLIKEGHDEAVADAGVAVEMAHSCVWGGIWTTRANLQGITDKTHVQQKTEILERLQNEAEDLYSEARQELEKRL
jgi:formiminotetrahydrofolate cyclodeaminase